VAQSGAYTRFVGRLRRFLPAIVFLLLLTLVVWPMVNNRKWSTIVNDAVPNLVVENLHFSGLDDQEQPYSLTALRAFQAGNTKNLVDLEKPEGEVTLNNGAWLAGKASYGRFDQQAKRLWLGGDVELFHDQGYSFTTSDAQLDLDKNTAWGDEPILIQGSFGEIRGTGFRVLDGGDVLVVEGHAKAKLYVGNLQQNTASGNKAADEKNR